MPKVKSRYICQECGYVSTQWLGRCPDCNQWNSLVEDLQVGGGQNRRTIFFAEEHFSEPQSLAEIELAEDERQQTGICELDRVLGGGIVPGSVILIGGDPGIGKSTLLLQTSHYLSLERELVLYISGEESARQTKLRAQRLGTADGKLYIVSEVNLDIIEKHINQLAPGVVVIDSIQTMYRSDLSSAPGSVSQVRECAAALIYLAKRRGVTVFLIGHVTKEGALAGPRILEHMVDTVLYFEGEVHHNYRILRSIKNRFGSTQEIGIFRMEENGLKEVANPSEIFLTERPLNVSGSIVVPCMEGTRPLLVELQALVSSTNFGVPRRMVNGVDYNRASLLFAVLEKRGGLYLQNQDVFLNVAGGVKLREPAIDLGIILAVASGFKNVPTPPRMVAFGEVGLGGEVRAVNQAEKRMMEAAKLGFEQCLVPAYNLGNLKKGNNKIELVGVRTVQEALDIVV